MKRYNNTAVVQFDTESDGNAAAGATVTVRDASSGVKATIYSDNGITELTNPFKTDQQGNYGFFVDDGTYNIFINEGLSTQQLIPEEEIIAGVAVDTVNVFDTLTGGSNAAVNSATLSNGDTVRVNERTTGNGGGSAWGVVLTSTVTPNGFNIVQSVSTPTLSLTLMNSETQGPKAWGLVLDGVNDDTSAFVAWANGTTNPKEESGTARVTGEVLVTSSWNYKPGNGFIVFPDLPSTGGRALAFEADNVSIEFAVIATGGNFTTTGNSYAVYAGQLSGATKYKNFTAKMFIKDFLYSDGLSGASNIITGHCIYTNNVDEVTLDHSVMDTSSGAAYFVRNCNNFSSYMVSAISNIWYPFNLESGVTNFNIENCTCDQTGISQGVFWGGGVNIQSQQEGGGLRNENGKVVNNVFTGFYSYGSIIRCNSATNIEIRHNNIEDVEVGSVSLANDLTGVRVDTRGISTAEQNGPCENVSVSNNRLIAGNANTATMIGVYISNQWQTARNPARSISVKDNEIVSTNSSRYWESAILFHGFEGGLEDVDCHGNFGQTLMQTSPIVDGAIGFVANNSNGAVRRVNIGGNSFTDLGTPASSFQLGLGVGQFVDEFFVDSTNTFDNYFFGTRSFTNSGPTLEYLNDIHAPNVGSLTTLFNVAPIKFKNFGEVKTDAELNDINDPINTQNKWLGKQVYNSTANKPVYAITANPNGQWRDGAGTATNTPV
jgi:hypothetical protein